ncbi:MAG: hypothetical protein JXA15_14680 [Spirochaetales bacterium]|nr:hypothetical protein [Spirochaetales bacterium]
MATQERKSIIELPVKVILTEEGTTFFIRNRKSLKKFKLADNVEEYGILLEKFTPASLQRLLLVDYVSKVEISRTELMSSRQEVMDLSKLIVYSLLYRQYDTYIFARILGSDVIKKWNRLNPANIIDEKTRINDTYLNGVLKDKEQDIVEIKRQILAPMYASISKNANLLPEEKNIQLLLAEKLLNNLRPFTWFIVTKFKGADGYEQLAKDIRTALAEYMEKSRIAEYVSLMIMELAMNSENSNLKREAKSLFKGTVDMNAVLFDPNVRRQVVENLERRGESVTLAWKIGGSKSGIGTQGRLSITIFNRESEYAKVKETIDERKSADLKKKTLTDFYKELPDGEANTDLGLYYLSYLSEACEKVNVKFESLVNQIQGSDLTVISMMLNL